ncbi:MAG: hypothetical protein IJD97_10805 [Clostridia bacterium]|nr:hypothetical protein [Clostridia bacterium]
MKKLFTLLLSVIILATGSVVCTNANNYGAIINKTVYTDIIASINDYNIASFNIDGYTAVVAEDLRNYGFDVQWKPEERALYITRANTNSVASTYIAPEISQSQIGKKAFDVIATDIKTYINGNLVTSYNIGGQTIIYFNDLAVFGGISYSDATRRLDLDITDGLNYKISLPPAKSSIFTMLSDGALYFEMNSADGLQIRWSSKNNSNKTINYYTTTYYMFNAVGDFAYDRRGNNYFTQKTVGPVAPGEMILNFTGKYEGEVYDAPCRTVMLYTVKLEYSDGTSETIYYNQIGFRQ